MNWLPLVMKPLLPQVVCALARKPGSGVTVKLT